MPVTAIVTLTDVKAHLNIDTTDTSHDTELAGFMSAGEQCVQFIVGPVVQRTVTEWYDGGSHEIALRSRPVVSVTSVTEYRATTAYTVAEVADPTAATAYSFTRADDILTRRNAGGTAQPFPPGENVVKIVYEAGVTAVPGNVRLGCLDLIRHWYQQTQQGGRPAFPGTSAYDADVTSSLGYAIPNRVRELLEPHYRIPGFA